VEPKPLVGAEVQRIRAAFQAASLELQAALTVTSEMDPSGVGSDTTDAAVTAGLRDLRAAVGRLEQTATGCVTATTRHIPGEGPTTDVSTGGEV
jgi:hypothetical protein